MPEINKEVIQKLKEEILLYKDIFALSSSETKYIKEKNIEEVIKILEEKQALIQKIGEIEKEIRDKIVIYANVEEVKNLGQELGKILKDVLEKEKENQVLLVQELSGVKEEISKTSQMKKLITSYNTQPEMPHFLDKKK